MIDTLYVHRPLLNAQDIIEWAMHQGFSKTLDPDDMHVTIAFSKKALPWQHLSPIEDELHAVGDHRGILRLGEKGATVLKFFHPHLHSRWREILSHGASWEHDGYRPHVTLTYEPHDLDLKMIEPYRGPLIFGPEKFAPVVLDWDEKIKEVPLVSEKHGVLTTESSGEVKYEDSIKGNNYMATESLASLLVKNIDLILEAFNVDEKGNLVEVNKRKVQESDEIFHQYFVKSMNKMFKTINEADPIMHEPNMMDPMGDHNGMHPMGHQGHMGHMGHPGHMGGHPGHMGQGDDEMLGDMAMDDMDMGNDMGGMEGGPAMGMGTPAPAMAGGMGGGPAMESADGDYDWVFNEETDMDIDSLFEINEEDDDEEGGEGCDDDQLNEFGMGMGQDDDMMGDPMDMEGGHNDFGGDMGGMGGHDHMMGGGVGDMGGMDGGMGGDDEMMTIHGTTDGGGEFEFSFDPETLGFDGGMGGDDDMSGMDGGMGGDDEFAGHESHGSHEGGEHEGGEEHHFGGHEEEDEGLGEAALAEKKTGTPGKGKRGPRTAKMGIVPANPAASHAAPFPTPQGSRQKRK